MTVKKSSDLLYPWPEDMKGTGGSQFTLNNTTYSGADIKVVVHMYDFQGATDYEKSQVESSITSIEKELKTIEGQLTIYSEKMISEKEGTDGFRLAAARVRRLTSRSLTLQTSLISAQRRLAHLNKLNAAISTKVLAEIQTLSVSTYRDKQDVRALGSVYPKGFTRGPRVIAGTAIFTVFDESVLYQFLDAHPSDFDGAVGQSSALLDQLPPVDITVAFANEYGMVSRLAITGVEFTDDGMTLSIEDLITENVVSWVARDIDPIRSVKQARLDNESRLFNEYRGKRASDLILEEDYQKVKNSLSPFSRFKLRRNPYM